MNIELCNGTTNNHGPVSFFDGCGAFNGRPFGWSYFFSPKPPAEDPNAATNSNTAQPQAATTATAPQTQQPVAEPLAAAPDTTPNRSITIRSPLYEVTLDSKGAVATSWILLRNAKPNEQALYADGSNASDQKPLQLISQKALAQTPRDVPFRLITADPNVTTTLNDRNYQISVPDEAITLNPREERQIEFTLVGDNGLEVKKSFLFRADSYVADLAVDLKQNGQIVPNTRLAIGASIGDHAINHHTFYQIDRGQRRRPGYYSPQGYYLLNTMQK